MTTEAPPLPLAGRRIGVTADRRWEEQAGLFEKRGATVLHGPSMRTVDLRDDARLRQVTQELVDQPPDVLVATTGVGMRQWLEAAEAWDLAGPLLEALRRSGTVVVARGAKASSATKGAGLDVAWRAPHETMAEVVEHVTGLGLAGRRVAVQLFDPDDHPATAALRGEAAELVEVPVYRWLLPDDPGPALRLVHEAAAGRLDCVTFTSQPAVRNLFALAAREGADGKLRDALNGPVLAACIGPVCAEAAVECGVEKVHWPEPNRLPAMVRQVAELLGPASTEG